MPGMSDEPTTATIHFNEKGKVQPKGYKGCQIDKEATVTLKGKMKQIGSAWDDSRQFTMEVSFCEIEQAAPGPVSLDTAVEEAGKTRKRVM